MHAHEHAHLRRWMHARTHKHIHPSTHVDKQAHTFGSLFHCPRGEKCILSCCPYFFSNSSFTFRFPTSFLSFIVSFSVCLISLSLCSLITFTFPFPFCPPHYLSLFLPFIPSFVPFFILSKQKKWNFSSDAAAAAPLKSLTFFWPAPTPAHKKLYLHIFFT